MCSRAGRRWGGGLEAREREWVEEGVSKARLGIQELFLRRLVAFTKTTTYARVVVAKGEILLVRVFR